MGIEQKFDKNLEKATKKQMSKLPPNSKFIFQQLLKNSKEIEENLDMERRQSNMELDSGKGHYCRCADGTLCHSTNASCYGQCCRGDVLAEYNVGNLRKVIRSLKETEDYRRRELNELWKCLSNSDCSFGCCSKSGHCGGNKPCKGGDDGGGPSGENVVATDDISVGREEEMGEATTTASSGAYETPRFWAKDKKNQRFAKQRWMPGAKYVKVKDKCKTFPYCNQGDINALEIWEKEIMRESAKNVAKKTGKSESEVREMIEKELAEIIRRSFYKSPIKDLVGGGKMNTPIGKIFTMSGNKPKYEK
mgnify:CR=1 FL=1|tara:strand:- start:8198 stop:9115 length:918 start_codon:yes stop_codon:yes gene_type:complete